jgi:SAM-dependent methyltransferase
MNPRQALSLLRWSIQHRGLAATIKTSLRRLSPRHVKPQDMNTNPFDQKYGVDTGGLISGGMLAIGSRNDSYNCAYYGMAPSRLLAGIDRWKQYISADAISRYSFIDLGSGKGRALMVASEHPFRQVIGVEINPGLASTATDNLKLWLPLNRSQCPIRILTQDAALFNFPEGPCVVYMYNPFSAPLVKQVIHSIERQFSARPGQLDLLYFHPEAAELFDQHPGFTRLWSGILPLSDEDSTFDRFSSSNELCNIYRWNPSL